jgi:hypothetical protein
MGEDGEPKKLDDTDLIKWILGGIGAALVAVAVFLGSVINNLISHRNSNEVFMREKLVQAIDQQTLILREIRDERRSRDRAPP